MTTPQLKKKLLKEISSYLIEKGVNNKDLKERTKVLKTKCLADLEYSFNNLQIYYQDKKAKVKYDDKGWAIENTYNPAGYPINDKDNKPKIITGEEIMAIKPVKSSGEGTSNLAKMQGMLEDVKKLKPKQLVEIALEGELDGVDFGSFVIDPALCTGDKFRMVAYKIQTAMGLGSEKADKAIKHLFSEKNQTASKEKAVKDKAVKDKAAKAAAPKKVKAGVDQYGFRVNTHAHPMLAALVAGVTMKKFKEIGQKAASSFLSGIQKPDYPCLDAKVQRVFNSKLGDEVLQLTSFYTKENGAHGKLIKPKLSQLMKDSLAQAKVDAKLLADNEKAAAKEKADEKKAKDKEKADAAKLKEKKAKDKAAANLKKDKEAEKAKAKKAKK